MEIDPRELIRKPFVQCPKCDRQDFGVLYIQEDHYLRRCRSCWHTQRYLLPRIRKKIVYLDQCAISNLTYVSGRQPTTKRPQPYWKRVLEKLSDLRRLQLIICPESSGHHTESIVSHMSRPLKDLVRALSHNVSFYDFETIKQFQLIEHLRNWVAGQSDRPSEIDARSILMRSPDSWTDVIYISVDLPLLPGYVEALRKDRDEVHTGLADMFYNVWKPNSKVTWEEWFERERCAYGPTLLKEYIRDLQQKVAYATGEATPGPFDFLPGAREVFFAKLIRELEAAGVPHEQALKKLAEFLQLPSVRDLPYVKISAALYACVAKKAPTQKDPPTRGFFTDVDVVGCLLPYCDAMFLDAECWTYLNESRRRLGFTTQTFSVRNVDEFLSYLDAIKGDASADHYALVRELYGIGRGATGIQPLALPNEGMHPTAQKPGGG